MVAVPRGHLGGRLSAQYAVYDRDEQGRAHQGLHADVQPGAHITGQCGDLLQALGLTRYEIPIDSRVTRWLNEFGFPIELSPAALGDIGLFGFWSMMVFLGVLTIGFIYEWKKGALEWE